ncbi:MAG: hypothetical protein DRJ38_08195 [Thermoprotei archaeon]|nr:MAG: hypothetical protein DRJ38_08195 [Thermoprotei archaeon]
MRYSIRIDIEVNEDQLEEFCRQYGTDCKVTEKEVVSLVKIAVAILKKHYPYIKLLRIKVVK